MSGTCLSISVLTDLGKPGRHSRLACAYAPAFTSCRLWDAVAEEAAGAGAAEVAKGQDLFSREVTHAGIEGTHQSGVAGWIRAYKKQEWV